MTRQSPFGLKRSCRAAGLALRAGLSVLVLSISGLQGQQGPPDLSGLSAEDRSAVERACSLERSVGGPASYYQCLRNQVAAVERSPGKPNLAALSPDVREAIERACSLEKSVGGPAAYHRCLRNQLSSLAAAPRKPDLSRLNPDEQSAIERACSLEKAVGGPAAYYRCLENQLASLSGAEQKPDLSALDADERDAVERACALERAVGGPASYYRCLRRQLGSLAAGNRKPDLSRLNPEERAAIERACSLERAVGGPVSYYECLRSQLAALGRSATGIAPPSKRPAPPLSGRPRLADVPSYARPSSAPPEPAWPVWRTRIGGSMPRNSSSTPIEPSAVFKRVAPSVYVVLAAASREQLEAKADVSQGSAVSVSGRSLATNCHVLTGNRYVLVIQRDKVLEARLVAADPASDRCLLEVATPTLSAIPGVRPHADLSVGERVYSVGAPSGFEQTLAEGLISGLREHNGVRLIQTSAPVSPGSSGGGLFDSAGNLVGITTFILRDAQALNFVIAAEEYWR